MPCSGWVGGVWMVAVGKPAERMSERHHYAMAHARCCLHSASCPLLRGAACAPNMRSLNDLCRLRTRRGRPPWGRQCGMARCGRRWRPWPPGSWTSPLLFNECTRGAAPAACERAPGFLCERACMFVCVSARAWRARAFQSRAVALVTPALLLQCLFSLRPGWLLHQPRENSSPVHTRREQCKANRVVTARCCKLL